MASTKTAKTPTSIQQAAICRCTDKATHEVFYTMKSDSSDEWYQVRWIGNRWQCSCPATKPCKHERAVNDVLAVRRSRIAAKIDEQTSEIVATMQAEEDEKNEAEADETPGLDAAESYIEKLRRLEREREARKQDAWKERSQFTPSHKMEVAPSGRLVPMR